MKLRLCLLSVALTAAASLSAYNSSSGGEIVPAPSYAQSVATGDINGDGKVDVGDISKLLDIILTADSYSAAADLNGDSWIDVGDITALIQILLGEKVEQVDKLPDYQVISLRKYTKAQLIDRTLAPYESQLPSLVLKAFKRLLGSSTDNFTYYEAIVRYKSIDHTGQPIDLSGCISYRTTNNGAKTAIDQLIIDSHATITDNASCPSKAGSVLQILMTKYAAAVISADYQGYGESRSSVHPYLNESLTARQQIDLLRVAMDYLGGGSVATALSSKLSTYCIGYSQGGAVALATHRMLECQQPELANTIGLKGSICGDGPYSLNKTLDAYISQGTVSIPVILPMIVRGMMESYPRLFEGLDLTDFFKSSFLNTDGGLMKRIDEKELNVMEYNTLLGASNPLTAKFDLNTIFMPGVLSKGSIQLKAMTEAFERNNCIVGWTPKHHVTFFHSTDDTVVPYVNLDDATSSWPSSIYSITNPDVSGVDHLGGAIYFYMAVIKNGPANM